MSAVDQEHTIQIVVEKKCNNPECERIVRSFEFHPSLTLSMAQISEPNTIVDFGLLRKQAFEETLKAAEGGRTCCPYCPEDGTQGSLIDVKK